METFFKKAWDVSIAELSKAGTIDKLPLPQQTVIFVHTAQGVIDNGGFQYFFESDFPHNPPYSVFIAAYERIGAVDCAQAIEKSLLLFDFSNPHLQVKKRNKYLNKWQKLKSNPLGPLDKIVCGNETVWTFLETYVKQHKSSFGLK